MHRHKNMYAFQGHGIWVLSHTLSSKYLAVSFWWRSRDSVPIMCWVVGSCEITEV